MNKLHLEYCASDEWAELVVNKIIPWTTTGQPMGDHVLEVGPGPGRTTEVLKKMFERMTAVELDHDLATALRERLGGGNLEVVEADATALPMADGTFSAAISLTMLHHVPAPELQDRLFAEVRRVLRPGGVFVGSDNLDTPVFREGHIDDICVPIDPSTLETRLRAAGFAKVEIETNPYAFRFAAST